MLPQAREKMILAAALEYFGSRGGDGNLRDFARHARVSSGLIHRYFGSKQMLMERVCDEIFISQWDEAQYERLTDAAVPFRSRLTAFYLWFFDVIDNHTWIRAGLNGELAQPFYEHFIVRILDAVARGIREHKGEEDDGRPVSAVEREAAWHLHSSFVYYMIRKHVHRRSVAADREAVLGLIIDLFFDGIPRQSPPVGQDPDPSWRPGLELAEES
jgi:AcrR family transcriptional regulator